MIFWFTLLAGILLLLLSFFTTGLAGFVGVVLSFLLIGFSIGWVVHDKRVKTAG